MVQRMRAAQEAMESEAKEEEFYLKALIAKVWSQEMGRWFEVVSTIPNCFEPFQLHPRPNGGWSTAAQSPST